MATTTSRPVPDPDLRSDPSHRRRVQAIRQLALLERVGDPSLTAVSRLAGFVTGARCAAVHILDDRWQHRIATAGDAPLGRHPIVETMCREVVSGDTAIICSDATLEERFAYSPFVTGEAPVRFYAAVPLRVVDGVVIGTVCAFDTEPRELSDEQITMLQDVAGQAANYIELLRVAGDLGEVAELDPLTGALNGPVFQDRLQERLAARSPGAHTALAVLDVDYFKRFNDTHGHGAGDAVLCGIVARLRDAIGSADLIGRLGGDEFAVAVETRNATPDRLRQQLSAALSDSGWEPRPNVTIGAVLAERGEQASSVIHRADVTMYRAKRRRRPLGTA